ASQDYLKRMLDEKFEAFTFSPAKASVYHLGNFGTARGVRRASRVAAARRIYDGKKNAPDDSGAITFSGTFSGTLVGARSGAGAGAGVWAGFGTVSGMSIGVEPG